MIYDRCTHIFEYISPAKTHKFSIFICFLADVKRYGVPYFGRSDVKTPNERLCRGTESKWLADERVDLAGLWYCLSLVRYDGWPVLRILWTKQASLNRILHSMGTQWNCLRSSVDVSGETEDSCVTTLASACCTRWRRAACFCGQPNKTELA